MRKSAGFSALAFTLCVGLISPIHAQVKTDAPALDRTILPIPEPTYPPITEIDVRKVKAPPLFQVKAPVGAPNERGE